MHSLKIFSVDSQLIKFFLVNEGGKIILSVTYIQCSTLRQRILCKEKIYSRPEYQIKEIIEGKKKKKSIQGRHQFEKYKPGTVERKNLLLDALFTYLN